MVLDLKPRPDVPRLEQRPLFKIPLVKQLAIRLAKPWFLQRHLKRAAVLDQRVIKLIEQVRACESRQELESLLGSPRDALSGAGIAIQHAGGRTERPYLVEVYERAGCGVEILYFEPPRAINICSYRLPTATEGLCAIEDSRNGSEQWSGVQ